jgi:Uma2 family endonuclease
MPTQTLMTADEFATMAVADGEQFELVAGELVALPSGNPLHARIRGRGETRLNNYFDQGNNGAVFAELDCRLNEDTVRRPDLSLFLDSEAVELDVVPVPFAPDIAVEILSPSETAIQVNRQALDYLTAGTKEVWIVDPANREVFVQTMAGIRLYRAGDPLTTPLLPGFALSVDGLLG